MLSFISLASGCPSIYAWSLVINLSTQSIIYVGKEHFVRIRVSGKTCIQVLSDMKLYPKDPPPLTPWWWALSVQWAWPSWGLNREFPVYVLQLDLDVTWTRKREVSLNLDVNKTLIWMLEIKLKLRSIFGLSTQMVTVYSSYSLAGLTNNGACWTGRPVLPSMLSNCSTGWRLNIWTDSA